MVGGSRIIAFGGGGEEPSATDEERHGETAGERSAGEFASEAPEDGDEWDESVWVDEEEPVASRSSVAWLFAALVILVAAGWTAFFAWAHWPQISARPTPLEWTSLVSDWAGPVLLVGIVWLVVMRSSTREASRFGDAARALARESADLEARLVTVNSELSLAREFLASQSRDLESFGRVAGERISKHAQRLEDLVRENGERVELISNVSDAALENMEKLRSQLPVIASSAKDVTNNIGNAGRTAHSQIEEMVKGFKRINEFGLASERQVQSLHETMEKAADSFSERCDQLGLIASERFAELDSRSTQFRTQLEKQEVETFAAIRNRSAAFAEELEETRKKLEEEEAETLDALRAHLTSLREEGGTIGRTLREDEDRALESWQSHLGELEDQRSGLFARIEEADGAALEAAKQRLVSIEEEARLVEEGIAQRAERLASDLAERRRDAENEEQKAITRLAEMLAALDEELARRGQTHDETGRKLAERAEAVFTRLEDFQSRIQQITQDTGQAEQRLAASMEAISERISHIQGSLSGTETEIAGLTDSSVRLLELVHASTTGIRDELPEAMTATEERIAALDARTRGLDEALGRAGENSRLLTNQIETSGAGLAAIVERIADAQFSLSDESSACTEVLQSHVRTLADLDRQSEELATKMREELAEALSTLDTSAREAIAAISDHGAQSVKQLAEQLGDASADAIDKAMRAKTAEAAGALEQAAAHAAGVSREAAIQLRDQLAKVDELAGNLEQRVTLARERAEEQVDNDFARRAALITEALNSNAIDIAKALSTDVSDTSWEGYLRGDRGIFTRRAVSLIETAEGKAIQQVFERDSDFREHVNRYIHDFEAILRQVLSTRDGNALGVTLLSSDMGKLYVALAQSIERLRA